MSETNYEQLGRFVAKRKFSLDAIEVLTSVAIMLDEYGDEKGYLCVERCIELMYGVRVQLGLPLEHKLGGMDRKGI